MFDLSIILVNYNGSKFIENCLNSIYKVTHEINFEIILVDNNSTDNSIEIVKTKFPGATIIKNPRNLGFCKANNLGLKIYRGRYAMLLNTDTITQDGAFDQMVDFMDRNNDAGACAPKLLNPDNSPQHQGGFFAQRFWLSDKPVKVNFAVGACLLVRRKVIDKIGGLDENFFFGNDDLDWCLRIRKAGWNIYYLPQAEVIHYGGFTTKRFNPGLYVEGFRGGLYFAKKHYGKLAYQIYRSILVIFISLLIIISIPFYPFLKNKPRLGTYWEILKVCFKGQILPTYG